MNYTCIKHSNTCSIQFSQNMVEVFVHNQLAVFQHSHPQVNSRKNIGDQY